MMFLPTTLEPAKSLQLHLPVKEGVKGRITSYTPRFTEAEQELIDMKIDEMLRKGFIEPSLSIHNSPLLLVKKANAKQITLPSGKVVDDQRLVVNLTKVNQVVHDFTTPLPTMNTLLSFIGQHTHIVANDMCSGFFNILVDKEYRHWLSFQNKGSTYQFVRCPFGLICSPSVFNRAVALAISQLPGSEAYVDDVITVAGTFDQIAERLYALMVAMRQHGFCLSIAKTSLLQKEWTFLGHSVRTDENGLATFAPTRRHLDALTNMPCPQTKEALQSYLGMVSYLREFVPSMSAVVSELWKELKYCKNGRVNVTAKVQHAFDMSKQLILKSPLIDPPKSVDTCEYVIATDASATAIGSVLFQRMKRGTRIGPHDAEPPNTSLDSVVGY